MMGSAIKRTGTRYLAIAAIAATMAVPMQTARAFTNCDSITKAAGDMIKTWEGQLALWAICAAYAAPTEGASLAVCGGIEAAAAVTLVWNSVAGDSWARIGPRALNFSKSTGTVIGTLGRVYITAQTFPEGYGFRLKKTGHKGKVEVAVCVVDEKGKTKQVTLWTFDAGPRHTEYHFINDGSHGKFVFIGLHIDGKSATKSFSYEVQLMDWSD